MNKKNILLSGFIVLGLLASGAAVGQKINFSSIVPAVSSSKQAQPLTDEQQAILAVRKAKASVVNILGQGLATSASSTGPLSIVPIPPSISGTGFVLDNQGTIVTNEHVIDTQGLAYFVVLADGTRYQAKVLVSDKFDDIALLKIDFTGLAPATLGDSDSLETGQSVFAIGNSLGRYEFSVTKGVVSGLERSINEDENLSRPTTHNWIQTDAAINPGNSGGPLINMAGEVIGMNTLIDTSGSSLGFAIPINAIKEAAQQFKNFGAISRPFIGITFATITPDLQASQNLSVKNGALVVSVLSGGPAQTGGLLAGDIIESINGQDLTEQNQLDQIVQKYQAGNQITFKILRDGTELSKIVILGQFK